MNQNILQKIEQLSADDLIRIYNSVKYCEVQLFLAAMPIEIQDVFLSALSKSQSDLLTYDINNIGPLQIDETQRCITLLTEIIMNTKQTKLSDEYIRATIDKLSDIEIQHLVRRLDHQTLLYFLYGIEEDNQQRFFNGFSKKSQAIVKEDLSTLNPIKQVDVNNAICIVIQASTVESNKEYDV
ncbi:FliG C-terminal domain-containing protein [Aliivibrio wodanis]|uniref:FliG C-terminal domain-containing protein n=1 Tax=Aliivibrio wodanis TaxID=80852 RepID=UPI00406C0BA1